MLEYFNQTFWLACQYLVNFHLLGNFDFAERQQFVSSFRGFQDMVQRGGLEQELRLAMCAICGVAELKLNVVDWVGLYQSDLSAQHAQMRCGSNRQACSPSATCGGNQCDDDHVSSLSVWLAIHLPCRTNWSQSCGS